MQIIHIVAWKKFSRTKVHPLHYPKPTVCSRKSIARSFPATILTYNQPELYRSMHYVLFASCVCDLTLGHNAHQSPGTMVGFVWTVCATTPMRNLCFIYTFAHHYVVQQRLCVFIAKYINNTRRLQRREGGR